MKERMGSELDMKQQVARGRLACAGLTLPRQSYDRAMAYPGGNSHIEGFGARHHPHSTRRGAGLLVPHAAAVAGGTHGRRLQRDRAGCAVMRLFEAEFDGRLNVLTTHGKARASACAVPGAKQRLKKVAEAASAPGTEEIAEIAVFHVPAFPARRRGEISARLPVLAELVVALTLLRIGEDCIGLPDILKFLFRGGVARVDVGVILTRQLAVGFLDVVLRRGARNAEGLVVVLELDSHSSLLLFWVMGQRTPHCATRTRAG